MKTFFHPYMFAMIFMLCSPLSTSADQTTLTLAAYNLKNAFDVFDDPYTQDEEQQVKQRWELQAIADAIRQINPDVIAFSELENEHVLRALVSEFLPDAGYRYIACQPTNSTRGINLGILSRWPIQSVTSYRYRTLTLPNETETWQFARDLMRVTITTPTRETLDVFIVHFKSKRDAPNDPNSSRWRLAEATETHHLMSEHLADHPNALIAVMGDFNDTPVTPPMQTLLADNMLLDMHDSLAPENRITYLREDYRSTLDYILTSPALAQRYVPDTAIVLDDATLLKGSDHAPIAATFQFPKKD